MRLFTATLATETNTFSPLPTVPESTQPMRPACAPRRCSLAVPVPRPKASN